MNLKLKKISIMLSLLFILLISLAVVSAGELKADLNDLDSSKDIHLEVKEKLNDNSSAIKSKSQDTLNEKTDIANKSSSIKADDVKANGSSKAIAKTNSSSKSNLKTNSTLKTSLKSTSSKTTLSSKSKKSTFVVAPTTIGKMGKKVALQARVIDSNGKKVKSGTLTFILKGKYYKVKVKNGLAKKIIICPFLGIYNVKAKYNGDSTYKASSARFKLGSDLKVKHKYSKSITVRKGSKQYYRITVINQYTKKALKKFKIKVKVKTNKKWKTYTIKSNSKGVASLSTKKLSAGTHNVLICSAYKYIKTNLKAKIVVVKQNYI